MRVGATLGFALAFTLLSASAPHTTQAQQAQLDKLETGFTQVRSRLKVVRPRYDGLASMGYVVGDNFVISPTLRVEGGYDSNFDEMFDGKESGYGLVDGSLSFGYVKPGAAVVLAVKGSYADYPGLDRRSRWDAGAVLDAYYAVNPNLEFSGGALFLHDAVKYTISETAAGYVQIDFQDATTQAFSKSIVTQTNYLSEAVIPPGTSAALVPFLANSEYDVRRMEQTAGVLYGRNQMVAPFVQGGYAWIDYLDQKVKSQLDRDAQEYWVVAGARVTFAPTLQADIGYRFNHRDLADKRVTDYTSTSLDVSLKWMPTSFYRVVFQYDRKLGEPTAAKSLLTDITTYSLTTQYKPTANTLITLVSSLKRWREIGEDLFYEEKKLAVEASYDYTNKTQFYVTGLVENVREMFTDQEFTRYRIGAGVRMRFADAPTLEAPRGAVNHLDLGPLTIGAGYSHFTLPEMKMTTITDWGVTKSLGQTENHDGNLDGFKIDVAVRDLWAPFPQMDRRVAFKGFWGHYQGIQRTVCNYTATTDCVFVNIVDVSPSTENNTGAFGRLSTRVERRLEYWGLALEVPLWHEVPMGGSLKDPVPVSRPLPLSVGVAMKALRQDTKLFAIDTSVPDPIDYTESLDTYYLGAYAAFAKRYRVRDDLELDLSADAGVYYANTRYEGHYLAFLPVGGSTYVLDGPTHLALDDQGISLIASARVGVTKYFDQTRLTLFAEGEYFSYVPKVLYNDDDYDGGAPFGIAGTRKGTILGKDSAFTYTLGARVTIPLQGQ